MLHINIDFAPINVILCFHYYDRNWTSSFHPLMMLFTLTSNSQVQCDRCTTTAYLMLSLQLELSPTRRRGKIDQKLAEKWSHQDTTIFPVSITPNTTTVLASRVYNTTATKPNLFHLRRPLSELALTRSRGKIDLKLAEIRPTQCHTHPSTIHSNTPT
jgi:hypothetical protein